MSPALQDSVAYVVKRYPRFSETFVVDEILSHEAAGTRVEIFALRPPVDTHFQGGISRVRAPVRYLAGASSLRSSELWSGIRAALTELPGAAEVLRDIDESDVRTLYQGLALALEIRRRGIGHIHAHFASSATSVARHAARFAGVDYTFTAHAKDLFHEEVCDDDLRRKIRDARAVVTVSDYNVGYLRERFGTDAGRVRRIYNGLDLEDVPFDPRPRPRGRVVAVGRLVEKKWFDILVDACRILVRRGVDMECRIVGSGELQSALEARIARAGVEDHVHMMGPLPRNQVLDLVRTSTVVAAPCRDAANGDRDGLPTVLLEAMAVGTPCVSTRVTGIPELVQHGVTGLLLPPADSEALADGLQRLLGDPELGQALARRARTRIEADFDSALNADRVRRLFHAPEKEAESHAA